MISSCLYPADVGCKYTIKRQNESPWKHAFSYSSVWRTPPSASRRPASTPEASLSRCFLLRVRTRPNSPCLSRHTGHDLFSTHPFQFTLSAYHPTLRNKNWQCAVKKAKTSEIVPTEITMKKYLLKRDAVRFGTQAPTCRRKILSPSWHHLQNLPYSEEGHRTLIRNVGAHLPSFIVSQHTKINFIKTSDQSINQSRDWIFWGFQESLAEFIDTSR